MAAGSAEERARLQRLLQGMVVPLPKWGDMVEAAGRPFGLTPFPAEGDDAANPYGFRLTCRSPSPLRRRSPTPPPQCGRTPPPRRGSPRPRRGPTPRRATPPPAQSQRTGAASKGHSGVGSQPSWSQPPASARRRKPPAFAGVSERAEGGTVAPQTGGSCRARKPVGADGAARSTAGETGSRRSGGTTRGKHPRQWQG